jgi:acetamidase/formamidase
MIHHLDPIVANLQGCFTRERSPILTVESGDTVICRTLDCGWGLDPFAALDEGDVTAKRIPLAQRHDPQHDDGHCLVGPIAVRGAEPGMVLEIAIQEVQPGPVGATWVGEVRDWLPRLGIEGYSFIPWHIDAMPGVATSPWGHQLRLRPFLGVIGVAPAAPGIHSTMPPRATGGNLDCKELVAGSTLYPPIEVPGALLSFGDGHAVQGDGEVGGTAIECGMERVALTIRVREDLQMSWPQANTPAGGLTFGLHADLTEAMLIALNGMLDVMMNRLKIDRAQALALASLMVDLRITQIVNGVVGVHALWADRLRVTN